MVPGDSNRTPTRCGPPQHRHFRGCLRHYKPHPSGQGGRPLELKANTTGRLHQHHLTGATIFGASSHGELKTLAIVVDAVNDTHQEPRDHTHHV